MLNPLMSQLESRIEDALETIQIMMLDNDELRAKLGQAELENQLLRGKETQWEQSLSQLLSKFGQTPAPTETPTHMRAALHREEEALA